MAKKRAEVAPGIGNGTDMFVIGPRLGSYSRITSDEIAQLEKTYKKIQRSEKESLESGRKEIQKYVANLIAAAQTAAAASEQTAPRIDGGAGPSTDSRSLSEPSKEADE